MFLRIIRTFRFSLRYEAYQNVIELKLFFDLLHRFQEKNKLIALQTECYLFSCSVLSFVNSYAMCDHRKLGKYAEWFCPK